MSLRRKPIVNFDKLYGELEGTFNSVFAPSPSQPKGISGMNMYQYPFCPIAHGNPPTCRLDLVTTISAILLHDRP